MQTTENSLHWAVDKWLAPTPRASGTRRASVPLACHRRALCLHRGPASGRPARDHFLPP
ncbi:hypothetical protein AWB74_03851 [Caballeronia arvi]|uniref:Uncharacterized protein n=1 Tax=Caballeronia arvi TaxID=1777135 RepID=A0A158JH53_9BURK|nr:hypothetical protein AWB74_03851 [Caballeronia arvi]